MKRYITTHIFGDVIIASEAFIIRFVHVMIRLNDFQESIDFYTNIIGVKLRKKTENPKCKYTLSNIKFALHVEPNNVELQKRLIDVKQLQSENQPTVPSTLRLEKATNPFLRCHKYSIVEMVSHHAGKKLHSEVEVFAELRQWKNNF